MPSLVQLVGVMLQVMMCTLVFQCVSAAQWHSVGAQAAIEKVVQTTNLWANYRIARSAARSVFSYTLLVREIFFNTSNKS